MRGSPAHFPSLSRPTPALRCRSRHPPGLACSQVEANASPCAAPPKPTPARPCVPHSSWSIRTASGTLGGTACETAGMPSPQSLSDADRRLVAAWVADCAERVLVLFETEAPTDGRPRDAIVRARAFARGELDAVGEIRRRFVAGRAVNSVTSPAAVAAARAAGQASGVAHMGAHALVVLG